MQLQAQAGNSSLWVVNMTQSGLSIAFFDVGQYLITMESWPKDERGQCVHKCELKRDIFS